MNAPKLPNFILAGAGESGTTSLFGYLKQHPQVFLSPLKEPNYFAAEDIQSLPGFTPMPESQLASLLAEIERTGNAQHPVSITNWDNYLRLFQNVRDQVAIGEASVMYLWFPSAAPAIHRAVPRAKLIFVLRDPAERLFTLYLRTLRQGQRMTFRDWVLRAMQSKPDRRQGMQPHPIPLDCGLYGTHLGRFFERFPREQIRIYLYDAYRADASAVLRDIFGFLGVDPSQPIDLSIRQNETMVPRSPRLHDWRRRLLGDRSVTSWLPPSLQRPLRGLYHRRGRRESIAPEDRQLVIDYYRGEILRAQDLTGRDLSAWLR